MQNGRGKIPSMKNDKGEAVGLKNWTNRKANESLDAWSSDPDYGFGVRLGRSGLIAIDCDCDDEKTSNDVLDAVRSCFHFDPPLRRRGSNRWACLFQLSNRECFPKRRYPLDEGNDILEILGDGQQLACAGTHPKGDRYEWTNGNVGDVHEIKKDDLEKFCSLIEVAYGNVCAGKSRVRGESFMANDPLADWLIATNRVRDRAADGTLYIPCPWESEHSDKGNGTDTCYFPIGTNGHERGGFKCLHAHCQGKTTNDFIDWCKSQGYVEVKADAFPNVEQGTKDKTTVQALQAFWNEKSHDIKPCLQALEIALADPDFCGYEFGFDTFAAGEMSRKPGGEWTLYQDALATELRLELERRGFKTPKKQDVIDMIKALAARNTFDSMADFLAANIPEWDNKPRVSTFFSRYCGAEESEWTISVALYMFTALWARASLPNGCKADIAPVLIGRQGTGKSSLTRILALNEDWCSDVDFTEKDADIARELRQKIIMEIPELGGMSKREQNGVKAFMTRKKDSWVPKFVEAARIATRRCVFIVTTNDKEFLTDNTGNRRWAPVEVGYIDREAVKRDLLQLWAEAREIYKDHGVMYEGVEMLQEDENSKYMSVDPWMETISQWVALYPNELLTTKNIVEQALRLNYSYLKRRDANAIASIMRSLGYERVRKRIAGERDYEWRRNNPPLSVVWTAPDSSPDE
ncbi:VapE domain-containing protein [Fibrobacter sp.]|uniref:VapE domain-containing protein n=1 Tax=Fibrobacter sp. TaxID=35828 RepID=UPI003863192C